MNPIFSTRGAKGESVLDPALKRTVRAELLHEAAGPGSPAVGNLLADSRAALATMRDVVWSIDAGADTVGALLDRLRDPAALPGWLVTTTQRECGRARRAAGRLLHRLPPDRQGAG